MDNWDLNLYIEFTPEENPTEVILLINRAILVFFFIINLITIYLHKYAQYVTRSCVSCLY